MEYTTTVPDSPSTIACGSDGTFLASLAPRLSMEVSTCHHTQGAKGATAACPHRRACYQALSEWYTRRGK
jgi:hypothetical protein